MKKDKFITDFEDIPNPRQKMPHLSIEQRSLNFKEVEAGFSEESALKETTRCLSCRRCIGCGLCLAECDQQAIVYDQKEEYTTVQVDSVVIATGSETFDARRKPELGYAYYPNVITNIEFERILNANGPFGGIIMRPADGEIPQRIAFIQCVGSREEGLGANYCSNICCMTALNQAMIAMDKTEEIEVSIFYTDIRPFSNNSEHLFLKAKNGYGIRFIQAQVNQVLEDPGTAGLTIKYKENESEHDADFDLIVLSTGMTSNASIKRLSRQVGARLNKYGFFPNSEETPVASPGDDVWFAGSITSPADLSTNIMQASAAAASAMQSLMKKDVAFKTDSIQQTKLKMRKKSNRAGIFFCQYGLNTQFNIDSDDVVNSIKKIGGEVFVDSLEYSCNTTGKQKIMKIVEQENLGRVIIAPCFADKLHAEMFQHIIQSAGLSRDRLTIFNGANQNGGWNTEEVKQKLLELLKTEIKANPDVDSEISITEEAAIIGDSVAALQAALDIAEQGFKVDVLIPGSGLAERDHQIFWHSENILEKSKDLRERVTNHSKIEVYKNREVKKLEGEPGSYKLIFDENGEEKSVTVGAIVVAPGAQCYQPSEFSFDQNKNIITQRELAQWISENKVSHKQIVMIQCIGSRQPGREYCSKICCEQAIQNALKIKELQPDAEIHILHRDIRVYDFEEDNYTEAVENGVKFIRMDKTAEIKANNGKFDIRVVDRHSHQPIELESDLVVLSNGILPHPGNQKIADTLKVALTRDGFFLESENMMEPLQCGQRGILIAGLAHSPQRLSNVLMQATSVAGKIGVIFRSGRI